MQKTPASSLSPATAHAVASAVSAHAAPRLTTVIVAVSPPSQPPLPSSVPTQTLPR
jgi:hypothetical protein